MLSGRDSTKMIGPLDSTTVIDKIEGGEIDTDSSMISFSPLGFDTPLWEPISLDKVIELYKIARNEARVTLLNSPGMATNAIPTKGSINGAELAELLPPQTNLVSNKDKDKDEAKQKKTKMTKMMKKRVEMKKSKATKTKWATKDD